MSIATLKLDEKAKLEFGVSITGASGIPSARFIIEKNNELEYSFPAIQTNNGVEVNLMELKGLLAPGEYKSRLEVMVENKIYTPLQDTISFEPLVEVKTEPKVTSKIVEAVKVDNITVQHSIDESMLRQYQAATIIATSLDYTPQEGETPKEIIENAVNSVEQMTTEQLATLEAMLKLAESVGLITK